MSPSPIRVGFVLHVMQVAGAEMLVAETIRRLSGRIEPVILCLDAIGALGEQLQAQGVPVVSFGRRPGRDWRMVTRMAGELRRRRVQVIHAHQYTPFFYSALARTLVPGRPPLIFTEHGRHYPDVVGRARRTTNRVLLSRLASEVNAVCRFSADALQAVDGFAAVPVGVIENGVDPERYDPDPDRSAAKARIGLDPGRRYIANVARLHSVKDQTTLLAAFGRIAGTWPDVDLLLVGDGSLRAELEAETARLGLTTRVLFMGVRRDVPAVLSAADVFCLTSLSEAASLTLLEAMAAGLPVVVSDVGGNPEIVRHDQEGLLAPRRNPEAFAAALDRVLRDPAAARRFGQAGAARVRDVYRLDRTIARYYDAYQRLTREGAARSTASSSAAMGPVGPTSSKASSAD